MSISHWKHLYVIKVVQVANQFSLSVVTKTRNDSQRPTTIHNEDQYQVTWKVSLAFLVIFAYLRAATRRVVTTVDYKVID